MLKKAHRDLAAAQRQLWKLQKEVSRGVTGVLVFLLRCLDYLAYVEELCKTQITTAMQISRISQYHNVQNGEDTLLKTCVRNMQLRCAGTYFFLLKSTHSDTII